MQTVDELIELEETARKLQAQNLRSKAVLLERLFPLIERANNLGHRHATIHQALVAAGVQMTFDVYNTTLKRVRKRAEQAGSVKPITHGSPEPIRVGSDDPNVSGSVEPKGSGSAEPREQVTPPESDSVGSAFEVKDALQEAQKASQVDYRKFARSQRK
ncbi:MULTISPECIES: hypothetical protein [Burkholderia]|jgi:hypothetical protein|nr:hypothetical protein [Burkholderia contaminans]HBN6128165.1 hypothetical protein [Clostridioides difficile]MBK1905431.1 hypothetical protein [Burkholderia contaminans]MBK1927309.1 hypothetical protein [Burkholderia contaminans]MBK1943510.1 hypothetical protein [Burkholderia contaminans]MBK1951636.1 hypothetical protein [Burkholderia contaminans]